MRNSPDIHPAAANRLDRKYAKSVSAAEDAVASARETYGDAHPGVAEAFCRLGHVHQANSEFGKAQSAFLNALEIRELNPEDFSGLAETLRALARLYKVSGRGDEARPLMKRAARLELEAYQSESGPVESAEPEYSARAEFVEEMAGTAPDTFWTRLFGGVLLPLALTLAGMPGVAGGRMKFYGRYGEAWIMGPMTVEGAAARLIGIAWVCAAAFAHFHFFWPYRNRALCSYGKVLAFAAGITSLAVGLIKMWTK